MKYLNEYRDAGIVGRLAERIRSRTTRRWVLMEICGGQTHSIMRYGLHYLLPPLVELVHGPGCPVCVTPVETLDRAIAIASMPNVIFVSYGDMLRVPGSRADLLHVKAAGGDVRMVYSPMDALAIARRNPQAKVVFFAIGFETTAPANALVIRQAKREGLTNFYALVSHVLAEPAVRTILDDPANRVRGLIAPGHVCSVVGYTGYETLARDFSIPIVVAGFEPVDLMEAITLLVEQLETGRCQVENQYARFVRRTGNREAQEAMEEVFEVAAQRWRGIGEIPASGLRLRSSFSAFDAALHFDTGDICVAEADQCISAQVLRGISKPHECKAFGTECTPEHPLGASMVSSEGACAAYYLYGRRKA